MRTHRRLLAGVAIVLVAVAVCLPGHTGLDWVLVDRPWTLVALPEPVETAPTPVGAAEQPLSLTALLPSRAPPLAPSC